MAGILAEAWKTRRDGVLQGLVVALFVAVFFSRSAVVAMSSIMLLLGVGVLVEGRSRGVLRNVPLLIPWSVLGGAILLSVLFAAPYPFQKPLGKLRYLVLYLPLALLFLRFPPLGERIRRVAIPVALLGAVVAFGQMTGKYSPLRALTGHPLCAVPGSGDSLFHATGLLVHHVPFSFTNLLLFHLTLGGWLSETDPDRRRWYAVAAGAAVFSIIASFSRGTWLALLVSSLGVSFVLSPRRGVAVLGIATILVGILAATSVSFRQRVADIRPDAARNNERLVLWRLSWEMFRDSPVLGKGFHGFASHRDRYATAEDKKIPAFATDPHSTYFDFLSGTGLVGIAAYLVFLLMPIFHFVGALRIPGLGAADRGTLLAALGCQLGLATANFTDTHFQLTNSLVGTLLILAMGEAAASRACGNEVRS